MILLMANGSVQMRRRFCAWSILPMCLFLVALGIRLPDLGNVHSTPKPRPRAVIVESTKKSGEEVTAKKIVVVALCPDTPALLPPVTFRQSHPRESRRFDFNLPSARCARAPPYFRC